MVGTGHSGTLAKLRLALVTAGLFGALVLVLLLKGRNSDRPDESAIRSTDRVEITPPSAPTPVAPPATFAAWVATEGRELQLARGVELARARRAEMKQLIQRDPRTALASAVPYSVRKQLPPEVAALLETPVSTAADLDVEQGCGGPAGSFRNQWVTLDGRRVQVFAYGIRAEVMSKQRLSVHGIAIDEVMAMLDDPIRELSAAEAADLGVTGRIAQLGNRLFEVDSDDSLAAARVHLRASEQLLGPEALPAYRRLALGEMDGMRPLAMLGAKGGTYEDLPPERYSAWTEGPKTMLYIRARFADEAPTYEPVSLETAQARQAESEQFWRDNSYGRSTLATTYTTVVTLPRNGGEYVNNFNLLHQDARAAAFAANPSWDHTKFSFYTVITNYATNAQGNTFPYSGIAQLTGKASHLLRNEISVRTASHEYGHNLGLNHSEYWLTDSTSPIGADSNPGGYAGDTPDAERIEYGHKFAIMSGQPGPGDFDSGRAHFAASDKNRLDWLTVAGGEIASTTTSGTFRLYRQDVQSADLGAMTPGVARAIKIDRASTDPTGITAPYKFWLSYRMLPTNGIAANWLRNGIQVDWRRDGEGFRAVQLDMTPYSRDSGPVANPGPYADNEDKEDGTLLVGRTFSDTGADIHFTPVAKGGSNPNEWLDVVVNIGTQSSNTAPQISSLTVGNAAPVVGQSVTFSVGATDANGDALAFHWDMGDGIVQSAQLNLATRTKSWSTPGNYLVRVEVSDMKGGKAVASTLVTVLETGTVSASGTWINASGGSWGATGNWAGGPPGVIASGVGNTADFSTLNPTADTTVPLDGVRLVGNLVFGDTAATASPAGWTLAAGTSGSLTLSGASPTITVNTLGSGKFASITAPLAGTSGFTKTGSGNLLLNNSSNTLSGPILLNLGNLQLNSASLSNATSVTLNAGSLVIATAAANAVGGTLSFAGGTLQFNVNPGTDYSPRFSNAPGQAYRIGVTSGREATFAASLSSAGGSLTKSNAGTLVLAAANSYSAGTSLTGGTLAFANASAFGSGPVVFNANSTLQARGAFNLGNALSIATGVTGSVDTNGNNISLAGVLTGNGNLTKIGAGSLNLSGGGAFNTLSGAITVSEGTLANDNVLPSPGIQSLVNMNGPITVAAGATFNFSQSFTADVLDNGLTLSGSGTGGLGALNLWRNAVATGPITLAADATISHNFNTATISGPISGVDRTLTLATIGSTQPGLLISGPIQLGTGGILVTSAGGTNIVTLSGTNSYSGETRVQTGTLRLTGNARLPDAGTLRIDSGAVLNLDFSGTDRVGALILGGTSMPNGTYGSLASAATNRSADFLGNGILQVGPANDYAGWAAGRLPPITGGPTGDDDGDGVSNLLEYALADGAERGLLNGALLSFPKRGAPYGADISYFIETSETLDAASWVIVATHGPDQLGATLSLNLTPAPGAQRKFARLRVELVP